MYVLYILNRWDIHVLYRWGVVRGDIDVCFVYCWGCLIGTR